jgi:uncharacterized protein YaiE (UPF0345 family)
MTKKILTDLDATGRTITASTFSGTATSTSQSLVLKTGVGTTEDTDLYTFNGGTSKTLNIVAGANITITSTAGQWSIASTGGFVDYQALTFNYR